MHCLHLNVAMEIRAKVRIPAYSCRTDRDDQSVDGDRVGKAESKWAGFLGLLGWRVLCHYPP